jgi:hypothetical protein
LFILDGRNRKRACSDSNITPIYKIFSGNNDMLYEFVKSKQIHRAHYTKDQLACYAAEVKEDVKKHNRELLSIKMKAIASNPEISIELPTISTHEYLEQMFGVGKQYISQAENILKNDLETFQKVKLGTLSLNAAKGIVADKKKVIAKEKKVIESDQPLEEKSIKTSFTLVEDAKVKEYIGLGLAKKEAETKVTELSKKVKNIIDAHKEESRIKIEISLPTSINKYLDDTLKDSGQSIDELFTALIVSFANFNDEENI